MWATSEYEKLPDYDGETWTQPTATFGCHATPEHLCHGWAVVGGYHNLALRLHGIYDIPPAAVPLFDSHAEAALHGLAEIDVPSEAASVAIAKLLRKYPRLHK